MNKYALLMLALPQVGCYAVGYTYPTLDKVPETLVAAPPEEVFAIRVDHRLATESGMSGRHTESQCLFRPLAVGETVPTQLGIGFARGYQVGFPMWGDGGFRGHKVTVRLYRRGYHTVELLPWEDPADVVWKPATTTFDQQQAVTFLVFPSMRGYGWPMWTKPRPGSAGARHREVLLFAAEEYERITGTDPAGEQFRQQAAELRKLAAE